MRDGLATQVDGCSCLSAECRLYVDSRFYHTLRTDRDSLPEGEENEKQEEPELTAASQEMKLFRTVSPARPCS